MVGLHQDLIGNLAMFCALWIAARRTPRRKGFLLRLLLGFTLFSLARYGYSTYVGGLFTGTASRYAQIVFYASFIPLTAVAALCCWEMDFWAALYCGSCAYCVQHIINKCYDIGKRSILLHVEQPVKYLFYLAVMLAALGIFLLMVKQQRADRIRIDRKALLVLAMVIVVTAIVLDLRARSAIYGAKAEAYYILNFYSIIAAAVVLCFQVTLVSSKNKEAEIITLRSLLMEQEEQYRFEKSMIDTLNIKVHDIRRHMKDLDEEKRHHLKDELAPVLEDYDARFRTGNPALDVILTRKSFACHEKKIYLTVLADGASLDFMRDADVYALFGNLLDNAIEATENLEEKTKKVIKLFVEKTGFFVKIHQENYFAQRLEFEDGLPRTTKPDTAYHGFGMKSIRMLAEQYDGSVKINVEGDRFILDIFFPL